MCADILIFFFLFLLLGVLLLASAHRLESSNRLMTNCDASLLCLSPPHIFLLMPSLPSRLTGAAAAYAVVWLPTTSTPPSPATPATSPPSAITDSPSPSSPPSPIPSSSDLSLDIFHSTPNSLATPKCTHPNCPVKKKVGRSLDGLSEISYKGQHNHQKPQPNIAQSHHLGPVVCLER